MTDGWIMDAFGDGSDLPDDFGKDLSSDPCQTCGGNFRLACPGPTAKTNAERKAGRMYVDWCYGMHINTHPCPDCGDFE